MSERKVLTRLFDIFPDYANNDSLPSILHNKNGYVASFCMISAYSLRDPLTILEQEKNWSSLGWGRWVSVEYLSSKLDDTDGFIYEALQQACIDAPVILKELLYLPRAFDPEFVPKEIYINKVKLGIWFLLLEYFTVSTIIIAGKDNYREAFERFRILMTGEQIGLFFTHVLPRLYIGQHHLQLGLFGILLLLFRIFTELGEYDINPFSIFLSNDHTKLIKAVENAWGSSLSYQFRIASNYKLTDRKHSLNDRDWCLENIMLLFKALFFTLIYEVFPDHRNHMHADLHYSELAPRELIDHYLPDKLEIYKDDLINHSQSLADNFNSNYNDFIPLLKKDLDNFRRTIGLLLMWGLRIRKKHDFSANITLLLDCLKDAENKIGKILHTLIDQSPYYLFSQKPVNTLEHILYDIKNYNNVVKNFKIY